MKIGIVNNGIGNVASVKNMLVKLGYSCEFAEKPVSGQYNWIILPGVGAFDNGIKKLKSSGWYSYLKSDDDILNKKASVLGICLGMQLLTEGSEEGELQGLNLIPGYCKKFHFENNIYKVPHMGWNEVTFKEPLENLNNTDYGLSRFYFVHSYYYVNEDSSYVLGVSDYGNTFVSAIRNKSILGVQFHPEKSHKYGMSFFKEILK